ncbi:hypothetical protein BGX28_009970 [Mortierella sp. GBA30]|nr:hypothetical protein BGX28_009970 [Mortierella sp. GBA30]
MSLEDETIKEERMVEDLDIHHYSYSNIADVPFEEFLHYALIQRIQEEQESYEKSGNSNIMQNPYGKHTNFRLSLAPSTAFDSIEDMTPQQEERENARRALRQAGWAAVFYLITTDILGPFNAPIAIAQLGYVPGVVLYTFMGIMAFYSGLLLWRLFIHLDSDRYPVRTYSDIAERIFGSSARHVCTFLQALQLLVNVGAICLANGQSLAQIVAGPNNAGYFCFSLAIAIWALVGMVIGQVRTLKNYSLLANFSLWINLLIIFTSMGFVAHSSPNFQAALTSMGVPMGPVVTHAFVSLPTTTQINGVMQMVYAYGGAMIFPEIMAEMHRPMDFWKGMAMAQSLIFVAYLVYGVFVYSYQGQFTLPLAYQGVSKYSWQTFGNALAIVTAMVCAGLYGNIGIKVAYIGIIEGFFNGPSLLSRKGHMIWAVMVVIYWALAYVIGSAVPQVENISSLIAAVCIMQFSYTFPPLLRLAYDVITDAMSEDAVYVPGNGTTGRVDSWKEASRWRRGICTGRVWFKILNFILFLGFLVLAALGIWGTSVSIQETFRIKGAATPFGCAAPV